MRALFADERRLLVWIIVSADENGTLASSIRQMSKDSGIERTKLSRLIKNLSLLELVDVLQIVGSTGGRLADDWRTTGFRSGRKITLTLRVPECIEAVPLVARLAKDAARHWRNTVEVEKVPSVKSLSTEGTSRISLTGIKKSLTEDTSSGQGERSEPRQSRRVTPTTEADKAKPSDSPKKSASPIGKKKPRTSNRSPAKSPAKRSSAIPNRSSEVWESYRSAYCERYGQDPIRNAKVNSLVCRIIKSVGPDDAIGIVRHYLSRVDSWYIRKAHDLSFCLGDIQKLHVEWKSQTKITRQDAQSAEFMESNMEAADRYLKRKHGAL